MTYFNFLFKKVIKNKINLIPLIIMILTIGTCFFFNNNNANTYSYENDAVREVKLSKKNIAEYSASSIKDNEHKEIDQSNLKQQKEMLHQNERKLSDIKNDDFQEAYDIDILQTSKDFEINKDSQGGSSSGELGQAIRRDNLRFQYLKVNNIEKNSDYYPNKSITFTTWILQNIVPVIFTICLIFILSQIFSDSYIDKIDITNLIPISRRKKLFIETLFGTTISLASLFLFILISYLIGFSLGGSTSWKYPFLSWQSNNDMYFQGTEIVFFKSMLLSALSIIILVELVYLITYLIRNKVATLFVNLLLICGLIVGSMIIEPIQKISKYLPTTYFNSVSVVSGQFSKQIGNFSVSYSSGIYCLVISAIILLVILLLTTQKLKKY